jgi:hypothetical protein
MNPNSDSENIGAALGKGGVERVVEWSENYAECERRRLVAASQAEIVERQARIFILQKRERECEERLRHAPPPGDRQTRRRRCIYYVGVAAILAISGFFFSLLALDPFQFGWKSYLYCLAIGVVTPFAVDKFLDLWGNEKVLRGLAATALFAALTSLVLLALIRGDILLEQLHAMDLVSVTGLDVPVEPQQQNDFYEQTFVWLRATMALLAIAMEIGAGLALHDAWRYGSGSGDDPRQINIELANIREEMIQCAKEIKRLENLSVEFLNAFWRDFYGAMLNGTVRNAITKGVLTLILFLCLGCAPALADPSLNLVVAIDLSRSLNVRGPNGKTEHEQNVTAISQLLSTVPTGSRVTIIAITDRSFTQPYILLSVQVNEDAGYFKERVTTARRQLARAWIKTSEHVRPDFPHTDVFGALLLAGQIFGESPRSRKILFILSDMRHEAFGLNLESPDSIHGADIMKRVESSGMVAALQRVEVYVAGAVAPGKLPSYWESLRLFWAEYFKKAFAEVCGYSVTRIVPQLDQLQNEKRISNGVK